MPSKYERKSSQQSWDTEAMMKAILAVRNGEMKFATAARHFSVPRNTLKRRVNNKNIDATENKKVLGKYRCIFNNDQEKEIVDHILEMEKRFYGLSLYDVRRLAFSLAEKITCNTISIAKRKLQGRTG
ncbi:hypothetical protein C0J52_23770 [Blattella germanica]|nr:hypothetical protein C0J52_23770 [Blattella germanica]